VTWAAAQRALCALLAALAIGGSAVAQERIVDFDSRIAVAENGELTVTETIKVVAMGDEIKRGIYRDFPTVYDGPWFTRTEVPFRVVAVARDGQSEPFHLEPQSNGTRVYVGQADVTLPPGPYTYTITYQTARQLGFFADHDELYWNVTGNGWAFPIEHAAASVRLPATIPTAQVKLEGYTGPQGSKARNLTTAIDRSTGELHFATNAPLDRHEGLTIVASLPKGFIAEPSPAERRAMLMRDNPTLVVGMIGLLLVVLYYVGTWLLVGRDPARGTIIPLFAPPLDLDPAGLRYVAGMGYDERCFTAALVSLAVKGWAHIEEHDGEYTITRNKDRHTPIGLGERRVNSSLLSNGSIELKQANHSTISTAIRSLREGLKHEYDGTMFRAHRQWLIPGLILSALAILVAGFSGPAGSGFPFAFMLVWISAWTFACIHLGINVWRAWREVARPRPSVFSRIGSSLVAVLVTAFALPFFAGEVFGLFFLVQTTSFWMGPVLVVLIGVNFLFFYLLKQPTLAGRKVMDQIGGFKMYLTTAEGAELAQAAPAKTPQLYERLLPYAIALGVENRWAEQFSDVLHAAAQDAGAVGDGGGGYHPSWYSGNSFDGLNATRFSSALSSSLSSSIASSSTAPGSSSGSSGGGSSGGGGGGGGGGGW